MKLLNPEIDAATAAAFGSLGATGQYGSTTTSSGYGSTSTSSGPALGTVSSSSGYGSTSASGAAAAAAGETNVGPYGPYRFAGSQRRDQRYPYLTLQTSPYLPTLCHTPNYSTTTSCIPTQPTNFHLGPSSSSRTSEEQSRASLCLARFAPRPPSRFARQLPRHVVSPCLASAAPR